MKDVEYLIENGVNINKSLELFGDIDTYNDTLNEFIMEISSKKQKLKEYKEISDMSNYAIYAHSIKSDAKYFGFEKLAELALDHEMAGKENNMYYVAENYNTFMNEIERVENICRTYMGLETINNTKEDVINTSKETILVVDDSLVIKKFIQNVFNNKYNVVEANDGNEAINIIANNPNIKIMLLDLNMPNVNGFQVLEYFKINNLFDKIKVCVITGVGLDDLLNKAREYDIKKVILKPFNERDIKAVVEEIGE